jgi:hypothetical protein
MHINIFFLACEGYRVNTPMIKHKSVIEHLSIYYLSIYLFIYFIVIFMVMGASSEGLKYLFAQENISVHN